MNNTFGKITQPFIRDTLAENQNVELRYLYHNQ